MESIFKGRVGEKLDHDVSLKCFVEFLCTGISEGFLESGDIDDAVSIALEMAKRRIATRYGSNVPDCLRCEDKRVISHSVPYPVPIGMGIGISRQSAPCPRCR